MLTTPLTPVEGRVLACLIEKQRTVPDQYPLTLLALVGACNQTTSREPVMQLTEHEVEAAVRSLKAAGLVRLVHPTHGRGVTRHRHVADEAWQLGEDGQDDAAAPELLAVLSVLMLRGPQTVSELRTRAERQHAFASLDEVEAVLARLASLGMVRRLDRRPGQTQLRWQQLVADEPARREEHDEHEQPEGREAVVRVAGPAPAVGEVEELRARVAELDARVARLEAAIADLL